MSSPGFESPFSGIGNLRNEIRQELSRKADSHEIISLRSKMDNLEYSLREIRSVVAGLESRLQILEEEKQLINTGDK